MPIVRAYTAGTVEVSTSPIILESIYTQATFGKIDVYDVAGSADVAAGTPVYSFTPAAETGAAKHIDLPLATGCVAVLAANTVTSFVTNPRGR